MDVLEVLERVSSRLRGLSIPHLLQRSSETGLQGSGSHQQVQDSEDGGLKLLQDLNGFIDGLAGPEGVPDEAAMSVPAMSVPPTDQDSSEESTEQEPALVKTPPASPRRPPCHQRYSI